MGERLGWAICLSLRPSAKNDPQDLGNDPGSKAGDNGQHQVGVSRIRQFMPQLPPKHFFPAIKPFFASFRRNGDCRRQRP